MTFAHVINESLHISNTSNIPSTKLSRLLVARQKLDELKNILADWPKIQIVNLDDVERTIAELKDEFTQAGYYATDHLVSKPPVQVAFKSGDIGSTAPAQVANAFGGGDVMVGYDFHATHQLRIPLRVLGRHGEAHRDMHGLAPTIAMAPFEGNWLPVTRTFRELGIDMDEWPEWNIASDIGPILSSEYLPFLLAVRSIVEGPGTPTGRRDQLINELERQIWDNMRARSGGSNTVADRFFPPFISMISGLSSHTVSSLKAMGLTTPRTLRQATDADLLSIKGVGPAKLRKIRSACSESLDPDEELVDLVVR